MVYLNPERTETVEELYRLARSAKHNRSYERYQAIALLKEGLSPSEVATIVKRTYATILNWIDRYNEHGVEGLAYKSPPGQQSWLTPKQKVQLREAVQKPPVESEITGVQWTYRQVIEFCAKFFQLTIKKRTAIKYLNELGFVRKRPKAKYVKADPEKKGNFSKY